MQRFKTNSGSTIIEVVISLAIISATFVIFQATVNTIFLNRESEHRDLALRIAQTEIDNMRALSFANLPTSTSFSNPLLSSLPQSQASRTITTVNSQTKQVSALVSWREPTAKNTSTVNLTTLITQGGI